jgi:ABC-type sugar transport system permease subunit
LWLADTGASFWAIVIADTWKTAPFIGLLTLAGLQTIPAEVYEAPKVDGGTTWQQFTPITLPMVKPTLVVAVLFRTLDTLRMFDLPYGMIGAGKYRVETLPSSLTRKQPRKDRVLPLLTPSSCSSTCYWWPSSS